MDANTTKAIVQGPLMSRRTLFSLAAAVGTLHLLGSTMVGRYVVAAYADDNGNTHFVVVVLSREEIAAFVVDSSIQGDNKPIKGARVTVKSSYNDQVVSGTTDDMGIYIANVRKLAVNQNHDFAKSFWFFASAEVVAEGYREFAFLHQQVFSGAQASQKAHILLPTQPYHAATDGAYLRAACFDGQDMLYEKCDIPKYENNDAVHQVTFQVVCKAGTEASLTFKADGKAIGTGTAKASSAGYATIELEGTYVADHPWATQFSAEFTVDGKTKACDLKLRLREQKFDHIKEPDMNDKWCMSVGLGAGLKKSDGTYDGGVPGVQTNAGSSFEPETMTIPKIPWGHDLVLERNLPWMPVTKGLLPGGGVGIAYQSDGLTLYSNKKATDNPITAFKESWKRTKEGAEAAWKANYLAEKEEDMKRWQEARQGDRPNPGWGAKGFFNLDITYQYILGCGAFIQKELTEEIKEIRENGLKKGEIPNPLNYKWDGTVFTSFALMIAGELGAQIAAGPVPVMLGLDFMISASPAVKAGVTFEMFFVNPQWFFLGGGASQGGSVLIKINGEGGLSAGVGKRSVFSVCVRGYVTFPIEWHFIKKLDKTGKALPFPHTTVEGKAGVQLVFQFLFVKARLNVIKPKQFIDYDNWKKKAGSEEQSEDQAEEQEFIPIELSDEEFYQDSALNLPASNQDEIEMVYTSDSMLFGSAEITAELNSQGVLCNIETDGVALPDASMLAQQGIHNPFASKEQGGYDPSRGVKPIIDQVFSNGSGEEFKDAFSDPRTKIVMVGGKLLLCRIAKVSIVKNSTTPVRSMALALSNQGVEGDDLVSVSGSDYYFVPDSLASLPHVEYLAGESGEAGTLDKPAYQKVTFYADDTKESDVAVANIEVPVYSMLGDCDGVEIASSGNTVAEIDERAQALAIMLGDTIEGEETLSSETIQEAIAIRDEYVGIESIASSMNDTVSRTRIVVTPFDLASRTWGKTDVIDFAMPACSIRELRANMNEVDFSVTVDGDTVLFGLVSLSRPLIFYRNVHMIKKNLFTSVLRYCPAGRASDHGSVRDVHCNVFQSIGDNNYEFKAEPFTMTRKGEKDAQAKTYIGLVATGPQGHKHHMPHNAFTLHYYPADGMAAAGANVFFTHPDDAHALNDDGCLQCIVQKRAGGKTDALLISWEYAERYQNDKEARPAQVDKQRASLWSVDTDGLGALISDAPRDFVGAECYTVIGADKGVVWMKRNAKNTEVTLANVKIGDDGLPGTEVDLGNVDTNGFFTSASGDYLYGLRIKEGSATKPSDEKIEIINAVIDEGGAIYEDESGFSSEGTDLVSLAQDGADTTVKSYQVVACRWDPKYKRYREMFPYAQLSSAPDDVAAFAIPAAGGHYGGTAFVYATLTNLMLQKAQLTYTEIPPVKLVTFESVACFDNFIKPDESVTVHPMVRVRNSGNVPIIAFTVVFKDEKGAVLGEWRVKDLEKNVVNPLRPLRERDIKKLASEQNLNADDVWENHVWPELENGDEYSAEDEAILWPGAVRNYKTEFKTVKGWKGANKVFVSLKDFETPTFSRNDDECLMFENEEMCVSLEDPTVHELNFVDSGEQELDADYGPVDYVVSENAGDVAAKTGDATSLGVGVAAAAAVVAGATAVVSAKASRDKR